VEIVEYLLSHPKAPGRYILSEQFSHYPVENYFGKQQAKGGRNENPSALTMFPTCDYKGH